MGPGNEAFVNFGAWSLCSESLRPGYTLEARASPTMVWRALAGTNTVARMRRSRQRTGSSARFRKAEPSSQALRGSDCRQDQPQPRYAPNRPRRTRTQIRTQRPTTRYISSAPSPGTSPGRFTFAPSKEVELSLGSLAWRPGRVCIHTAWR
eukprot:1551822-Pyramimonas_sp.AAC.2